MADQLEPTGVNLQAEGADSFVRDVDRANSAVQQFGATVNEAGQSAGAGTFDRVQQALGGISPAASQASSAVTGVGAAGTEAGAGVEAGAAVATAALGAIAVVAGVVVAALVAIGSAVNNALSLGSALADIQAVTGASAGLATEIYSAGKIAGVSVQGLDNAFVGLNQRLEESGARADKSLGRISSGADNANKRLARLAQDYAQQVADTQQQLADRLATINEQRVQAEETLNKRLSDINASYNKSIADSREQLAQRLGDLDASHADRVASINDNLTKAAVNYADKRADVERTLNERITALNQSAVNDTARVQSEGAKKQTTLQEQLQSSLASIDAKYASQRQSLQDKIYNPSTNPILRAYYKSQLQSLGTQQTAEQKAAQDSFAAKRAQAATETQIAVDAITARLARETAIERTHAAQQLSDLQTSYAQRTSELQAQLTKENAAYQQQTGRLRDEQSKRESDLRSSFDRQSADAQAAYAKQIADAAKAQAAIEAETTKRLAREKLQYDRGVQDANDALSKIASGGGGGASATIDRIALGLKQLGLSADELRNKSPAEVLDLVEHAAATLISSGHLDQARAALQLIFSPEQARSALAVAQAIADNGAALKNFGLTQAQIDSVDKYNKSLAANDLAMKSASAQIGAEFLPALQAIQDGFTRLWKEHGPAVVSALTGLAQSIVGVAVPAIRDIFNWLDTQLFPALGKVARFITGQLVPGVGDATSAFNRDFGPAIGGTIRLLGDISRAIGIARTDLFNLGIQVGTVIFAAFNTANTAINNLNTGLTNIGNTIGTFISGRLADLQNTLNNLHVPDIFHPGSPTPFELGIRGIASAMREVNSIGLPSLSTPASYAYSGGASRPQSVAATPGQLAASSAGRNYTSNASSTNTASVVINVTGNASVGQVRDGVYQGLQRAGLVVVN